VDLTANFRLGFAAKPIQRAVARRLMIAVFIVGEAAYG